MSRLTSLFSLGGGGASSMSPQNRTTDGLTRLRFTLETLPGSKKYIFSPETRSEIYSELYDTFWGPHGAYFVPSAAACLPMTTPLSEAQIKYAFHGAGSEPPVIPGKPCGHIFAKGESCYRCKYVVLVLYFLNFTGYSLVYKGIVRSMIAVSCVPDASMQQVMKIIMLPFTLLNNPGDVVIVVTRKLGAIP